MYYLKQIWQCIIFIIKETKKKSSQTKPSRPMKTMMRPTGYPFACFIYTETSSFSAYPYSPETENCCSM